jgi:hypothetical protein
MKPCANKSKRGILKILKFGKLASIRSNIEESAEKIEINALE